MTQQAVFRPQAEDEVLEVRHWYEARREGLGKEFAQAVDELVDRIVDNPLAYQLAHKETRRAVLSRFPKVAEKCLSRLGLVWMTVNIDGKTLTVASLHLHWPYPYGQWQQIEDLRREFAAMPRPVLIAGDFNAAPWSESVRRIAEATSTQPLPGLRLSLRMGSAGIGPYLMLPIDHILAPAGTSIGSIKLGPPIGSDHLPIVGLIGLELH